MPDSGGKPGKCQAHHKALMTLVSRPPTVVASSSGTTNHAQNLWLLPEAGPLPSTTAPALHHLSTRRCHHPQGRDKRLALGSFRPLQKTCVIALWGQKVHHRSRCKTAAV